MKDLIGQTLGRYHIIEPLGQGGMASVFKGFDTLLERNVAVKIIRSDMELGIESEFLKRFQREARSLAQLDHPFILKVLDYGEQDGVPYLVMPYVPGGTLKQKMGSPMSYQEAAALLAPIARALDYAHHQKIIHRDVKPANILISQSGAPLLSDFGIAKMLAAGGSTQLTATGVGIGTPDYMAPEQWAGEADPRTDIYSLGVVFYEMITGHRPFTADTPAAILLKHLRDPLPRPKSFIPDLPDAVELVLFKVLDKEPENRYQDMGQFADVLEQLARNEQTVLVGSPEFQTILPTVSAATELYVAPKTRQEATQPRKKAGAGRFLVALAILAVAGFACLVVGGAIWISFSNLMAGQRTEIAPTAKAQTGQAATSQPQAEDAATQEPQTPPSEVAPPVTPETKPFESIEGYPEDVPFLKDNNGDLAITESEGMNMFTFTTDMAFADAEEFYKTGLEQNGWELTTTQTQGNQKIWYYLKDETRMVMIGLSDEDSQCRVMIMLMAE